MSRSIGDRSGKAICRTSPIRRDMHAVEGSDRAVVPMKLPNQEAFRASAEVVEGRARTKENVAELHTSPTQSGKTRVPGVTRRARSEISLRRHLQGKSRMLMPLARICAGAVSNGRPYRDSTW